eukprot:786302-Alexandrium_andersonii.AAC.1
MSKRKGPPPTPPPRAPRWRSAPPPPMFSDTPSPKVRKNLKRKFNDNDSAANLGRMAKHNGGIENY